MENSSNQNEQNKDGGFLKNMSLFKNFRQDPERQDKVYEQIKENAKGNFDFYILALFSGIIITLGILINSTAVVIGGMLIAPLVWPIMAMSLGVAMGRPALLRKSLFILLKSIVIIIVVAALLGFIVPELVLENSEIFERTSPTIFELIIGLAAGFIGAFIVAYPKLGSAIAGVVIAAAIVPPVSIVGISFAKGDINSAIGALLLFFSNLIAIIFSAVILFLISDFSTRSQRAEKTRTSGFRWSITLLLIIIIPLFFITKQTVSEVKTSKVVKDVTEAVLKNSAISDLEVQEKQDLISILLTIRYKENISNQQVQALESILSKRLGKEVVLKIQVVPVVDAGSSLADVFTGKNTNEETTTNEDQSSFIDCPLVINGVITHRLYPKNFGCPTCVEIILCEDGREYPEKIFNKETGFCDKIEYMAGEPCEFYTNNQEN